MTHEAAAVMLASAEPTASADRLREVRAELTRYGYTTAELSLVAHEYPRDPDAAARYGRGYEVRDVERIVRPLREARDALRRDLRGDEVVKVVGILGRYGLTYAHFQRVAPDHRGAPRWRFVPTPRRVREVPDPNGGPPRFEMSDGGRLPGATIQAASRRIGPTPTRRGGVKALGILLDEAGPDDHDISEAGRS